MTDFASAPTADLAATPFDTIVVGSGVSGLTAARFLAQSGQRVHVLEARTGGRTAAV